MADASGVAFVPRVDAERVLNAAEDFAMKDAVIAKALLVGKPISEVMGGNYGHMLES